MAEEEMAAPAAAEEAPAEAAAQVEDGKLEVAAACVAALLEAGVASFAMRDGESGVEIEVDGAKATLTAEQLAAVMDGAEAPAEGEAEAA